MERKALTCSRCGAPVNGDKCEYCGANFEIDGKTLPIIDKPALRITSDNESKKPFSKFILDMSATLQKMHVPKMSVGNRNAYVCELSYQAEKDAYKDSAFINIGMLPREEFVDGEIGMLYGVILVFNRDIPNYAIMYGGE